MAGARTVALVGSVLLGPGLGLGAGCQEPPGSSRLSQALTVPARVAEPPDSAEPSTYPGVLFPVSTLNVAPTSPGRVEQLHVGLGDVVEPGQLLATLESASAREALTMARAELTSLKATSAADAVDVDAAERHLDTERGLQDRGVSSEEAVRAAELRLQHAQARNKQSLAGLAQQRGALQRRQRRLEETRVTAPFAGRITELPGQRGSVVGPTMPLARLVQSAPARVRFAVSPEDARRLGLGDPVQVQVETMPTALQATVVRIGAELDRSSHLVFVDAAFVDEARVDLRPGLAAEVRVLRAGREPG